MFSKLRTAYRNRYLIVEAIFWLGVARLVMVALPFRWIVPYLGERMAETPQEILPVEHHRPMRRVAWIIGKLSPHTPWQSKCLVQAMAAKWMLRRRRIHSTLYLGVMPNKGHDKSNPDPLLAHAWLRSGRTLLTGYQGHQKFTVVATFADGQ